jgi:hypothetical protein
MPYFKAPDNSLHFLSADDLGNGGLSLLPIGCTEITDDEVASIQHALQVAIDAQVQAEPIVNAEQKLAAFLSANPDVLALVTKTN